MWFFYLKQKRNRWRLHIIIGEYRSPDAYQSTTYQSPAPGFVWNAIWSREWELSLSVDSIRADLAGFYTVAGFVFVIVWTIIRADIVCLIYNRGCSVLGCNISDERCKNNEFEHCCQIQFTFQLLKLIRWDLQRILTLIDIWPLSFIWNEDHLKTRKKEI